MDYRGDFFPEEQNEYSTKAGRIIKRIFKTLIYGLSISLLVFLTFYAFIYNRDSELVTRMIFNESVEEMYTARDSDAEMYRIFPATFMSDQGEIQLYNLYYAKDASMSEICVKYNKNKFTGADGSVGNAFSYTLTDSDGNSYELISCASDIQGRYCYERICFDGTEFDLESNDLNVDHRAEGFVDKREDKKFTLSVYNTDGELVFSSVIYSNSTSYSTVDDLTF